MPTVTNPTVTLTTVNNSSNAPTLPLYRPHSCGVSSAHHPLPSPRQS
jgi:hypothetical protein